MFTPSRCFRQGVADSGGADVDTRLPWRFASQILKLLTSAPSRDFGPSVVSGRAAAFGTSGRTKQTRISRRDCSLEPL